MGMNKNHRGARRRQQRSDTHAAPPERLRGATEESGQPERPGGDPPGAPRRHRKRFGHN